MNRSSLGSRTARRLLSAWTIALVGAIVFAVSGFGSQIEQQLQNARAVFLEKPATGQLVLVEIDAQSLKKIDKWPWSRDNYAAAVDRLNAEGVAQIAFDVDFSANSIEADDLEFAAALERSDATVILPTLRQLSSTSSKKFTESFPIDVLREHALLGSVNVHPDADGQLNHYSFGTITAGIARPSIPSMLAESSGRVDQSFLIDQSIDPNSIPRISFSDIIDGGELPVDLSGKKVLIGATAIEIGDRYPIQRFGVVPGVLIQAMAAETLLQGTAFIELGKYPPILLVAFVLLLCLRFLQRRGLTIAVIVIGSAMFGLQIFVEYYNIFTFSNVPAVFFLGMFWVLRKFFTTSMALKTSQYFNTLSGLPNEDSFHDFRAGYQDNPVVVAHLSNFGDALALTNVKVRSGLFLNLAERMKFLGADDKVFHLQADTFAWVMKDEYTDDVAGHCETASALFQVPVMSGNQKVHFNAVFGLSRTSLDSAKVAAEQAASKNIKWAWHDEEADNAIGLKQSLLVDLDLALQNEEITVVYQPKWNLKEDRLNGAEALVRWKHKDHGYVSPELFIPMLERADKIDDLTQFVLKRTLSELARWQLHKSYLSCSINISAQLLSNSKFVEQAIALVEDSDVANEKVIFEVTETATLADPEVAIAALDSICETGIKVSIDDYGTGQSTMSYLQRLPVDEIKIDKSFVQTMVADNADRVLVESTIQMAHGLNMTIVAEGIENQKAMDLLIEMGCDIGQGWHISKPVSSDDFYSTWIENVSAANLNNAG